MQRDFDLIRLLLLELEGHEPVDISKYDNDTINYHKALLIDAQLAVGKPHYTRRGGVNSPDMVVLYRLTPEGHDFINKARSDTIWNRAKTCVYERGLELSFDALKTALSFVITKTLS